MPRRMALTVFLFAVMTAGVSSQPGKPVTPLGPGTPTRVSTKVGQALINGSAVDTNAVPLPKATVRLRNLADNQIEQVLVTNNMGQFTLIARPEVPYVVEIADRTGRILAVSDIITAQAGDVAGAVIAIPYRLPAVPGIFGDAAQSVFAAAMNGGIAVIDPGPPLSPEK